MKIPSNNRYLKLDFLQIFVFFNLIFLLTAVSVMSARNSQAETKGSSTNLTYKVVQHWKSSTSNFGPASAVAMTPAGQIVLFHRHNRTLRYNSSNVGKNNFLKPNSGPINSSVIFIVDPETGETIHHFGKNLFYMPHGLTVAKNGDIFVTDVILHQVFKFKYGQANPALILGDESDEGGHHGFCGPTSVAVHSSGDFFVADGYCNSRIIKFNEFGHPSIQIGQCPLKPSIPCTPMDDPFKIVHDLALTEEMDMICAADRENGRIRCFSASNGSELLTLKSSIFGSRLFSIAFDPQGSTLFALNGPTKLRKVQGFVMTLAFPNKIVGTFSPCNDGFRLAHGLAVSDGGKSVYVTDIASPPRVWKFERVEDDVVQDKVDDVCVAETSKAVHGVDQITSIGVLLLGILLLV